jgi:hypothetical protein
MNNATILSNRPFNINDGNRYIIIAQINDNIRAYARAYMNKPKFTGTLIYAKTFKDIKSLNISIMNININHEYKICQVKDIFEPKYYVKYSPNPTYNYPSLICSNVWSPKDGEESKYVFDDFNKASEYLKESKMEMIEFYYKKIMDLKKLNIIDIIDKTSE